MTPLLLIQKDLPTSMWMAAIWIREPLVTGFIGAQTIHSNVMITINVNSKESFEFNLIQVHS